LEVLVIEPPRLCDIVPHGQPRANVKLGRFIAISFTPAYIA
jgi:hypothetical protein